MNKYRITLKSKFVGNLEAKNLKGVRSQAKFLYTKMQLRDIRINGKTLSGMKKNWRK